VVVARPIAVAVVEAVFVGSRSRVVAVAGAVVVAVVGLATAVITVVFERGVVVNGEKAPTRSRSWFERGAAVISKKRSSLADSATYPRLTCGSPGEASSLEVTLAVLAVPQLAPRDLDRALLA
jgi:hypothetical protein